MDNDAVTKIQQRMAELPPDVRNAIEAADLDTRVQAVGAKNGLHIDQMSELEDEVLLAMLGFSPLETLGKRLTTALRLAPEAGEKLATDVGNEIFGPVRESMKKFVAEREQKVAPPAAPQPAPPAPPKATAPTSPLTAVASAKEVELHKVDTMLAQKTVSLPPVEKPIYKADPYREPVS